MKLLRTLAVLVTISATSADSFRCPNITDEYIAITNQKAKTWQAGNPFKVKDWQIVKEMYSGVSVNEATLRSLDIPGRYNPHNESEEVPETFDARETWSKCDSIKQIWHQGGCGSCWAVAAAAAMSDRICIHSNQTKQVYVSAENLLACCYYCSSGCIGGYHPLAWYHWMFTGIVTGGPYNSSLGCQDYSIPPNSQNVVRPKCAKTCYDTSLDYETSKTKGQIPNIFTNEKQIKLEIYKNGPVEAYYEVYCDFRVYKSGVYQSTTTDTEDWHHAIKIIGWGVQNNTPYWLIANSWGAQWAENGYFKMLRGTNESGIEDLAVSSLPILV